ncbi:MAG TPA: DCC1-like thiol-disulfide oxidoreductase family protein [Anaeromyxobacteraceae bacterium]
MASVILYDGACRACQAAVRVVLPRDRAGRFRFARQDGPVGTRLLAEHGLSAERGRTLVLVEDGRAYLRSEAALRIAARLDGPLRHAALLRVLPRAVRDAAYDVVARHRRLLGAPDRCLLLSAEERARFLDDA